MAADRLTSTRRLTNVSCSAFLFGFRNNPHNSECHLVALTYLIKVRFFKGRTRDTADWSFVFAEASNSRPPTWIAEYLPCIAPSHLAKAHTGRSSEAKESRSCRTSSRLLPGDKRFNASTSNGDLAVLTLSKSTQSENRDATETSKKANTSVYERFGIL